MTNQNEYTVQGLQAGNNVNQQIAKAIAEKTGRMVSQTLNQNFTAMVEAEVAKVVQETVNKHSNQVQEYAKNFLNENKMRLVQNIVDTQHEYRLSPINNNDFSLDGIGDFDIDLLPEVEEIANQNGSITLIETDTESSLGF